MQRCSQSCESPLLYITRRKKKKSDFQKSEIQNFSIPINKIGINTVKMLNMARKIRSQKGKDNKDLPKPAYLNNYFVNKKSLTNPNSVQGTPLKYNVHMDNINIDPGNLHNFVGVKRPKVPSSTRSRRPSKSKFSTKIIRLSNPRPGSDTTDDDNSPPAYLNGPLTMRVSTGTKCLSKGMGLPFPSIAGSIPGTSSSKRPESKISMNRFKSLNQQPYCRKFLKTRINSKLDKFGLDKDEIDKDVMENFMNKMVDTFFLMDKKKRKKLKKDIMKT
ncbi:unnamed protein product [Moneuplotes crassus]|uniref:Uncharacterized protein n=1 Tax=Euplotes crassus TaxID=5936 RepID=A0AAD1XFM8_EUPCR|nr:unnamed protein product [Moneuplotes crassus]